MRKHIFLLIATIMLLSCCGCGAPDGSLYSKSKVLERVRDKVPSENFTLDFIEPVPDSKVSTEIYHFKSSDRDFEFTATNTRTNMLFEDAVYGKTVIVNYADAVHNLYIDDITNTINNSGLSTDGSRIRIDNYMDLDLVSSALYEADSYYSLEKAYNSEDWMEMNPATIFSIDKTYKTDDGQYKAENFCSIKIHGSWTKDSLYDYLCYKYASSIKEGLINDDSVPTGILEKGHISSLKKFYVNDIDIVSTCYENAFQNRLKNNQESAYWPGYCYLLNDYVIPINVGITDDDYAPKIFEEVMSILNLDYEIKYKSGVTTWKSGGSSWKMTATNNDYGITSFSLSKDSKDYPISCVDYRDFTSPVQGTYWVGITATDFADIFDLDMKIDEENSSIYFYSK